MTENPLNELAKRYLDKDVNDLELEEQRVLIQIQNQKPVSRDAANVADRKASFGERLSDRVAALGGSWSFIIAFGVILLAWMLLNTDVLSHWGLAFDPYPYIFLNLILSMLAAIQAPVIMMSQNRQSAKDRVAANLDFEVNLRAELEVLRLHNKIDNSIVASLDALAKEQAAIARHLGLQEKPPNC